MQETEKLYYFEPHLFECSAHVTECCADDERYRVVLDRTCLFPTGGGQPCDTGAIDGIPVSEVKEKDGVIYHFAEKPLEVGKTVKVTVDKKRRMDHSCQHTGEHMISGMAHKLFGAKNVGFHMAESYSTLDFDIMLTDEQLFKLEYAVNAAVRENIPITYDLVDAEKLHKLTLRKKTDGIEDRADKFRIVYIGDVDSCTCCGTHTAFTGEVGIIKFNAWQKYKSGIRIWFLCAERAFNDYSEKQRIVDGLAKRFSTKQSEVSELVAKQGDDLSRLKHTLKLKNTQLYEFKSKKLYDEADEVKGIRIVTFVEESATAQELCMLSEQVCACGNAICFGLSRLEGSLLYVLCASQSPIAMNELCKTVNALFNAEGGGRDNLAQGKAPSMSDSQLEQSISQFIGYLKAAL